MAKQKKKTAAKSFPINIPMSLNLAARERELSFRDGLFAKRRDDFLRSVASQNGKASSSKNLQYPVSQIQPTILFLFATAEQCLEQAKRNRVYTIKERLCLRRTSILLITLLSRTPNSTSNHEPVARLASPVLSFLSQYCGFSALLPPAVHSGCNENYLSPLPFANTPSSYRYSCGVRLFHAMQQAKYSILEKQEMFADESTIPGEECLVKFWFSLGDQQRRDIVKDFLMQVKGGLGKVWCQCNCCKHRRMGAKDLLDQLYRFVCEELERIVMGGEHVETRAHRSLYRAITAISSGLFMSRNRPIFDVLSAFSGLRFTDRPESKDSNSDDEGYIEYRNRMEEFSDGDEDDLVDDILDYSDDEELIEAVDGELPIDEAELTGPIAMATRRITSRPVILEHDVTDEQGDEKLVEQGRLVLEYFISDLFHHRIVLAFLEAETKTRQQKLLAEEDFLNQKEKSKLEKKKRRKRLQESTKSSHAEPIVKLDVKEEIRKDDGLMGVIAHAEDGDDRAIEDDSEKKHERPLCDEARDVEPCLHEQIPKNECQYEVISEDFKQIHLQAPPGFEAPPGFSMMMEEDKDFDLTEYSANDPYNYLTSSLFGPSLLNAILSNPT